MGPLVKRVFSLSWELYFGVKFSDDFDIFGGSCSKSSIHLQPSKSLFSLVLGFSLGIDDKSSSAKICGEAGIMPLQLEDFLNCDKIVCICSGISIMSSDSFFGESTNWKPNLLWGAIGEVPAFVSFSFVFSSSILRN